MIIIFYKPRKDLYMREEKIIISLVTLAFILSLILFTNIGYAQELIYTQDASTSITDSTFNVSFNPNSTIKSPEINIIDSKTATLNSITLDKDNKTKVLLIPISNTSNVAANVHTSITNTNSEYFKVTSYISQSTIQPNSDDAIVELKIELLKQPIIQDVTSNITIEIHADPIY